jgi:hypothetical protein
VGHLTAARGFAWDDAAVRTAIALGPAGLVGLAAAAVGRNPIEYGFLVLLVIGLFLGSPWVWFGWHGAVTPATLYIDEEQVAGSTPWPLRRRRSVRLDRLARVRYFMSYGRGGPQHYIALRDELGGRLMAVFILSPPPEALRPAVLRGVEHSASVRVGRLTRLRLAGDDPRRAGCLWSLQLFAWVLAIVVLAFLAMVALGGW